MFKRNRKTNVQPMEQNEDTKKKHAIRATLHLLYSHLGTLVLCEIIYVIFTFLWVIPLFNYLFDRALESSDLSYLKFENLLSFLIRPVTLVFIIILLLSASLILFYNMVILLTFFSYARAGRSINLLWIYFSAFKRTLLSFRPKNIFLLFLVWVMTLVSNVPTIIAAFTKIRIPSYLARNLMQRDIIKVLLVLLVLLCLVFIIHYLFALPYCVLEGKSLKSSFGSSRKLCKGKKIRTTASFLIWNLYVSGFIFLIYILMLTIVAILVAGLVVHSRSISVFLTLYDRINMYMIFISIDIGIIANIGFISTVFNNYRELDGEIREPFLKGRIRRLPSNKHVIFIVFVTVFMLDIFWLYDISRNGVTAALENFEYTQISAHRGSSYYAPENTLPAIERAIENGADYAEIDVQLSKDGVVVLYHDFSLARRLGVKQYVYNLTYDQLQKYDAGIGFSDEYKETRIPTLEEVLEATKGKIKLNIELKTNKYQDELPGKVTELIKKYEFERQCVISSTNIIAIKKMKELDTDIRCGRILTFAFIQNKDDQEYVDFYSMRSVFVSERTVNMVHKMGKELHVWTVNNRTELNRMKELGVDNIITDKPLLAREVLYEEESVLPFISIMRIVLR